MRIQAVVLVGRSGEFAGRACSIVPRTIPAVEQWHGRAVASGSKDASRSGRHRESMTARIGRWSWKLRARAPRKLGHPCNLALVRLRKPRQQVCSRTSAEWNLDESKKHSAFPIEQAYAKVTFECFDLQSHCRLGKEQPLGGLVKVQVLRDDAKYLQAKVLQLCREQIMYRKWRSEIAMDSGALLGGPAVRLSSAFARAWSAPAFSPMR